jgi:uncharacterized protein
LKYVLVVLVVLVGFWLWRRNRSDDRLRANSTRDQQSPIQKGEARLMTRCQACGLHFPQPDAVRGKSGEYCSLEHLRRMEP